MRLPCILTKEDSQKNLVIDTYFATINQEDFEQTAALFAEDGKLLASPQELLGLRN